MTGNALLNKNPESVVLRNELNSFKHERGCAVCKRRNKKHTFGDSALCSDPTMQPQAGDTFCGLWVFDEEAV